MRGEGDPNGEAQEQDPDVRRRHVQKMNVGSGADVPASLVVIESGGGQDRRVNLAKSPSLGRGFTAPFVRRPTTPRIRPWLSQGHEGGDSGPAARVPGMDDGAPRPLAGVVGDFELRGALAFEVSAEELQQVDKLAVLELRQRGQLTLFRA